jgi:hypothetical protein
MEVLLPFLAFGGFFAFQARRRGVRTSDWLAERNRRGFGQPGWWKPMARMTAVLVVVAIVGFTIDQGFRIQYLLVIPLFGGFLVLAATLLTWASRR